MATSPGAGVPDALAIVNARISTGDPRRPWADAILVRGERVALVGSSAEIRKAAGSSIATIDAKGMLVTPPAGGAGALAKGGPADLVMTDRDSRVMLVITAGRVTVGRDGIIR